MLPKRAYPVQDSNVHSQEKKIIAGNWKMNINHSQAVSYLQELNWRLIDNGHDFDSCEIAVFPSFTDLRSVQTLVASDDIQISYGAQDVSAFSDGAHTGQISAQFLKDLDCKYVLIGHSEQRCLPCYPGNNSAINELNNKHDGLIANKLLRSFAAGICPILCIGDISPGDHFDATLSRFRSVLSHLKAISDKKHSIGYALGSKTHFLDSDQLHMLVAYEPSSAINSGNCANSGDIVRMAAAIKDIVNVRVLYGGGVNLFNASAVFNEDLLDGILVGRASLNASDFASLIKTCCL